MVSKDIENEVLLGLVRDAKKGDTEAFGKIYDHFFTPVYRYAAIRVPAEIAEDLVAEIFVKAWEKLHMYKERKNIPFGAWLFRIARNEVVDTYRTSKTWEEIPEDLSDPDELNRADTRAKRGFILKIVRQTLEQLPKRYREVLALSFIAGLSHEEVAQVLKTSEGSVRILKFRALRKFKELLPEDFEENL